MTEVRGCADKKLRDRAHPTHFSNRRVSILVPYGKACRPSYILVSVPGCFRAARLTDKREEMRQMGHDRLEPVSPPGRCGPRSRSTFAYLDEQMVM